MATYALTVSTNDLGLGVLSGARVVVERRRTQISDIFSGQALTKNTSATNTSGIAVMFLSPDDSSVYHELKIFDLAGIPVYSVVFTMPPQAVALTDLPVGDIISESAQQAVQAKEDTLTLKNAAQTSATNAANSETNAANSETNAANSAGAASESATNAANSAGAASESATNASNAQTAAESARDATLDQLASKANLADVYTKSQTYTKAEVDTTFAAYVGGRKAYTTLALAQADQANLPANTAIEVTNDTTSSNNGTYQWDGTTLTKSDFDLLTQAKSYTDTTVDAVIKDTNISVPTVPLVDVDGWFYGAFYEDGSMETPFFKINNYYNNGFIVIDEDGWILLEQNTSTSATKDWAFYEDGSMETPLFKINNYYNNGFIVIDEDGWILLEQNTSTSATKDWSQKNIILFGDSITETSNVEAGIYDSLAYRQNWLLYAFAMLEIKSFRNFARSGASYREYPGQLDWQKISHQVGVAIGTGFTPDIVVISCGTNDGVSNLGDYDTAMGKAIGSLDMSLTAEAMRKNFYEISNAYPNAKLFSCLPLQRADVETSTRQPLLDLIRKMSGRYGFTVIDCHNETGIVKDFEIWNASGRDLVDGLHPKTSGQIKQAKLISAKIKSNYQLQV